MGEFSGIKKSLTGVAVAKLGKGVIKESKIFDTIASLTGVPSLKNPSFDEGLFNFNIKDEKVLLDGSISSPLFKVSSRGIVDFEKEMDIPTEIKLSPDMTGNLQVSLAAIKFLKDEQGWRVIPFEIKGTTDKPRVRLDQDALRKRLGHSLREEIERRLLELKSEEPEKSSLKTKARELLKELLKE